jgi:endonuclease/exonuclease/phosphatase family metal-dependent hydrolase
MLAQPRPYLAVRDVGMTVVRVATFNIKHGLGGNGRIDLERTAATIRAARADLVALQEVDRNMRRSGRVDQPAVLEELTGLRISFGATLRRAGGEFGLALAGRAPIEAELLLLPRLDSDEERRAVLVGRAGAVTLFATHLSLRPETRAVQTLSVAEMASAVAGPKVVAGDLNQQRSGLAPLVAAGLAPQPERLATIRTRLGWREFDFVLAGGGARVRRAETIERGASDHRLVVAEVALD